MVSTHRVMRVFCSFAAFWPLLVIGCGKLPLGSSPNDPIPSGSVVAQGVFTSSSSHPVSGSAVVYSQGSGNYVVRLNNMSITQETGLEVHGVLSSGPTLNLGGVLFFTGNTNYPITTNSGATWKQVTIYSPAANQDYGIALLQ